MSKMFYVGLERYQSRYSYDLENWTRQACGENFPLEFVSVGDSKSLHAISNGQVLDACIRPLHALMQISELIQYVQDGSLTSDDLIFFEDMYHPGLDGLAYALALKRVKPLIVGRCLAQTIDPDDFTSNHPVLRKWMPKYEKMALDIFDVLFVASHEMVSFMRAAGWNAHVLVTGLPFSTKCVREVANCNPDGMQPEGFHSRKQRVVFASRLDWEKQPVFFLEVARTVRKIAPHIEFAFLSGKPWSSNRRSIEVEIRKDINDGLVSMYDNLSKEAYYDILKDSRVLFNCALQDWVSNTVSEADALGCNLVFPAYRSFVELFVERQSCLYTPWNVKQAADAVIVACCKPDEKIGSTADMMSAMTASSMTQLAELLQDHIQGEGFSHGTTVADLDRMHFNRADWSYT
jgi:glycosyltransferase involved in cell wall biosynthesis